MRSTLRTIGRALRVVKRLARDQGVPRWLRGMLIFGLLPIPGPVDDIVLVVVAVILFTCYRSRVSAAWAMDDIVESIVPMDTWGAWA